MELFLIRDVFIRAGGREGAKQPCITCRGHGIQIITRQVGPNMMQRMQQICKDCSGEGKSHLSLNMIQPKLAFRRRNYQ